MGNQYVNTDSPMQLFISFNKLTKERKTAIRALLKETIADQNWDAY